MTFDLGGWRLHGMMVGTSSGLFFQLYLDALVSGLYVDGALHYAKLAGPASMCRGYQRLQG